MTDAFMTFWKGYRERELAKLREEHAALKSQVALLDQQFTHKAEVKKKRRHNARSN